MNVRLGDHEFDDVVYDAERDVLYMHKGNSSRQEKPLPRRRATQSD